MPIEILLGLSGQSIILSDSVIEHFSRFQQTHKRCTEAGGQLFGSFEERMITVREATGPRTTDKRSRYLYIPNRAAEQVEINDRFNQGLHFLGDWHTHPHPHAHPSPTDLQSMRECVLRSRHSLKAFLLIIVGTAPLPRGMHVSLHDGETALTLALPDKISDSYSGGLF
jgi:integrative and conjugative element protein (TIGR02256 family)